MVLCISSFDLTLNEIRVKQDSEVKAMRRHLVSGKCSSVLVDFVVSFVIYRRISVIR